MATQYYPTPQLNDSTGIFELFNYVNNVADGLLFLVMLFVIWVITFIATKQYSTDRAFTYASFICMILAILLAILGLLGSQWMYLFVILTGVGAVWLKLSGVRPY